MKDKSKWIRIMNIAGMVALIAGVLDPLEGSVVIAAGSILLALSTFLAKERQWKLYLVTSLMILVGVFFLFYLSSLGGFGGTSALSWWWGTLILPYPIGWLLTLALLISKWLKTTKAEEVRS